MEAQGKVVFEFERIEANILGFKIPLPKFASEAGFVEVQVSREFLRRGSWVRRRTAVESRLPSKTFSSMLLRWHGSLRETFGSYGIVFCLFFLVEF